MNASRGASLALVVLLTACSSGDPKARFGPAAVVPGDSGHDMEAAVSGTLEISADCVLLQAPTQGDTLLVFRDGQVSWDADAEELQFEDSSGTVTLADGLHVELGGGGSSGSEDGESTPDYVAGREWSSPPAEECWRDVRFEVHTAEVLED